MSDNIKSLRTDIKQINKEIIELIAERVQTAKKIGAIKQEQGKPIHQPDQETKVLEFCRQKARSENLDPDQVEKVFTELIAMSRHKQKQRNKVGVQ